LGGEVDKKMLYQALLTTLMQSGDEIAEWVQHLQPYGDPATFILFVAWQSNPYVNGAFKRSEPGQNAYVQDMFYDFQKARHPEQDDGLYIAGAYVAWTSGWVEDVLQTGLNAAAGVVHSLGGTLHTDAKGKTPSRSQG
jgi:monoamine oxidase